MVKVPAELAPLFGRAEADVTAYLSHLTPDPRTVSSGVPADPPPWHEAGAVSARVFDVVQVAFGRTHGEAADAFAWDVLFGIGHALGQSHAHHLHGELRLTDPLARLAAGLVYESHMGWAQVAVLPETQFRADADCCLVYDHDHMRQPEARGPSGRESPCPVCIVAGAYASGWAEQSLGRPMVVSEVLCRAAGDACCRFVLAPPDRVEACVHRLLPRAGRHAGSRDAPRTSWPLAHRRPRGTLRRHGAPYRACFEASPIAMWDEDLSAVKDFLDGLKAQGVTDFRAHFHRHPEHVTDGAQWVRLIRINTATLELFGIGNVAELRRGPAEMFGQASCGLFRDELIALAEGQTRFEGEAACQTANGEQRVVHLKLVVLPGHEETLDRAVASVVDITGLKRAQAALHESEEIMRALLNAATDSAFLLDATGRVLVSNEMGAARLGKTVDELLGLSVYDLLPADVARSRRLSIGKVFRTGQDVRFEDERAGRVFDSHVCPVCDADGKVTRVAVFAHDITERRRLEMHLREAQKMDAIGKLAGGIAHDFNNLLTAILGYANMLKLDAEPGSFAREAAETIEKAGERAARLTSQLLGFARRGKHQVVPADLHATIREIVALLDRTLPKNIRVVLDLAAAQATVLGDPAQMQQVLLNLAINARDAMPEGGVLTFQTGVVHLDQEFRRTCPDVSAGAHLMVAVTDTGVGIPEEIQGQIFDPFFTTKEAGHGTGMGLAMAYGIVKNHNGCLQVDSRVGRGTTFTVCLPLTHEPLPAPVGHATAETTRQGATVLLVDDEEVVRAAAAAMLRSLGCEVLTASSGTEAVALYSRHAPQIDLVLIDMVMPEMDGGECFRALKRIDPDVTALLSSGYEHDGKTQAVLDEAMCGFIQKPYRPNELDAAVRRALSSD